MTSRPLAALAATLVLTACGLDLETNAVQDITAPVSGAQVRFFNFGIGSPSVNFYANDTKVTAVASATGAESTVGVAYGSAGNGGLYSVLAPGAYTFNGRIIGAVIDVGLPISAINATVAQGKRYSVYQSGVYNTTAKSSDGFVVEDPIPESFDFSTAYIRFVNASHNSNPMTLSVTNTTTNAVTALGGAVAYRAAGAFTAVDAGTYNIAGACTTTCNSTGAGNNTTSVTRQGITLAYGRYYTITLRGDITLNPATTTLTNRAVFDFTPNR